MRIVFWGTPEPAVPSLQAFLAAGDVEVAAVVCNPDRPAGRGYRLVPPPVKTVAEAAGVPVWQPVKAREVLDDLRALEPDACAVVAYGALLPEDVLATARAGFVNLHFSLLPAWRGAAPVQHTILHGDPLTGVTCFVLDKGMDTGPVLATATTPVGAEETAGELGARLAELGAPVLVGAVRGLVDGTLRPEPQPSEGATLASKITKEHARIDWTGDAPAIVRAVRAFNPAPGAFTTLGGTVLKVHRARVAKLAASRGADPAPGDVVRVEAAGPVVACGQVASHGAVVLEEVQPAGKARMTGRAFANGYRPEGRRLGA